MQVRLVGGAGIDAMVAAFLAAEAGSSRFGSAVHAAVASLGAGLRLVVAPDLADHAANAQRRRVPAECRGFPDRDVFTGVPADTRWYHVEFAPAGLDSIRYINWQWWLDVTSGSRRPADALHHYRDDPLCREIATAIAADRMPPPIIMVAQPGPADIVVLEGHPRLTAMHLPCEHLPPQMPAILGISPHMSR